MTHFEWPLCFISCYMSPTRKNMASPGCCMLMATWTSDSSFAALVAQAPLIDCASWYDSPTPIAKLTVPW